MNKTSRLQLLDSLRVIAMLMMSIGHFCFDLNYFEVIHINFFGDAFWVFSRALVVTLFTLLVGISFSLGTTRFSNRGYQIRLLKLAAACLLISVASYIYLPSFWVFFGILHFVLFSSLIAPLLIRFPRACAMLSWFLIVLPFWYRDFIFQKPALVILGLGPLRPFTLDFVPLMPWLGVVMLGVWMGSLISKKAQQGSLSPIFQWNLGKLARMGHYSFAFYLIHQAVLFPLAWLIAQTKK